MLGILQVMVMISCSSFANLMPTPQEGNKNNCPTRCDKANPSCCDNTNLLVVDQRNCDPDKVCWHCLDDIIYKEKSKCMYESILGMEYFSPEFMFSQCQPKTSCVVHCSELISKDSDTSELKMCKAKYGTCEKDDVAAKLAEVDNKTLVFRGYAYDEVKWVPKCENTLIKCNCDPKGCQKDNENELFCFVTGISDPRFPSQNCYQDTKWNGPTAMFFSYMACVNVSENIMLNDDSKVLLVGRKEIQDNARILKTNDTVQENVSSEEIGNYEDHLLSQWNAGRLK